MAMIKDALSSVPSKPALWIAPLLVIIVLSLYYRDQYNQCVDIRETRDRLNDYLQALELPASFRMQDFTDFAWTRVRIVDRVAADTISDTCPLEWNWKSGEREALIDQGLLVAMVFAQQGQIVRYLELRSDEVQIRGAEGNLTPQQAVFGVKSKTGARPAVILTLQK